MFSRLTTVNNSIFDVTRYTLLRLYLIKTTRGRAHALGKPSRGQRTWSNAWTAYNVNKTTRAFIGAYQRVLKEKTREEKINYKLVKRKSLRKKKKDAVSKVKIKVNN
jgi:ribosomal protein S13